MTMPSRLSHCFNRFDGQPVRRPRDRGILPSVAALLALVCLPSTATSQAPDPGSYSPAVHDVIEERGHLVPMRDGVRLSADIYFPDGDGPFAAILTITPYDNNGPRDRARWFARRGYVVVLADSRGRYDSGGDWDPFIVEHKTDGYDLVEWIGSQAWSNGNVGMIGGSYLGWTQWWTASQAPPSLKAIAPEVAPPDPFHNIPYQQGIMLGPFVDWAAWMSGRTAQVKEEGPYGGFTNSRWEDLLHAPYLTIDEARGMQGRRLVEVLDQRLSGFRSILGRDGVRVAGELFAHDRAGAQHDRLVRRGLPRLPHQLPRHEGPRRHARVPASQPDHRPLVPRPQRPRRRRHRLRPRSADRPRRLHHALVRPLPEGHRQRRRKRPARPRLRHGTEPLVLGR